MTGLAFLILGSAAFYAAATVLMKHWALSSPPLMAVLVAVSFIVGAWCEVEALRTERLATVYIAILGVECCIIAFTSFAVLGETVSARELSGGAIVIAGLVLAAS